MKTMTIDGEKYVKEKDIPKGKVSIPAGDKSNPFMEVGCEYFIQTVTHYFTGRLIWVGDKELAFESVCWIPDTGRFNEFIKGSSANESEPYKQDDKVIIGRGALISMSPRGLILAVK
jgi:hypothetical protein